MNTTVPITQTNQELTIPMYLYYFHLKTWMNGNSSLLLSVLSFVKLRALQKYE